jgi:two-component system, sensor histidine kinase
VLLDGDLVRLAQVFCNLLINASKFTQDGGCISLEAGIHGERLIATAKDNGIGIEPAVQPYIFDLFTQGVHSLARTEGGLGIGLTVARSLLEMHGGSIGVSSDGPGRGSTFEVSLPVSATQARPTQDSMPAATVRSGCRVLLIEDNVDANETLCALLQLVGHSASSAFDGITGLDMAMSGAYDVILCDIGLPGMNGMEFARRLHQQSRHAVPLMIATSGYGQAEDRLRALDAGYDEYLVKPVQCESLLHLIASHMAQLQGAAGATPA